MTKRFIQENDLPKTLWCKDTNIMKLPVMLVDRWRALLVENKLEKMALKKVAASFIGGVSKEDTDKHLAWRYNGSCGRLILSLLGPDKKLDAVSDAYASTFAGNKVFLADLPCGSGAATISILTTLAELRKQAVIPRMPITIVIVAGDISVPARSYFNSQLDVLIPLLHEEAICIEYETVHWDVLDPISTADLIKKLILSSQDSTSKMLILSNFTGFLESSGNWTKAKPQFDNIFLQSRDECSTAIWIEPQKNNVASFMDKVINWFQELLKYMFEDGQEKAYAQVDIKFQQPIKSGVFHVRLTVMRLDLPLGKAE